MPGFMPSLSVCTITFENSQNDGYFSRFQTCFAKLFFYPALLCVCAIFLGWFVARKYQSKKRISLLLLLHGGGTSHVIGLYFMSQSFYFHLWFQFVLFFGPLWRRGTVILHPRQLLISWDCSAMAVARAALSWWLSWQIKLTSSGKGSKESSEKQQRTEGSLLRVLLPPARCYKLYLGLGLRWGCDGATWCSAGTWGERGELRLQAPRSLLPGPWQPCASCCALRCFAFLELVWFFCCCCFVRCNVKGVGCNSLGWWWARQGCPEITWSVPDWEGSGL